MRLPGAPGHRRDMSGAERSGRLSTAACGGNRSLRPWKNGCGRKTGEGPKSVPGDPGGDMGIRRASGRYAKAVLTVALCLVLVLAPGLSGCGGEVGPGESGLKVAVSIPPLADFCREVGGGLVEVKCLLPPGASPHTYELTADQAEFLSGADLLVTNGLGLDSWLEETAEKVGNPRLKRVAAAEAVPQEELLPAPGDESVYDPHVWLDPLLALYQVRAVADALAEVDPSHADVYRENALLYEEELKGLDAWIRGVADTFTRRSFVSFHPAWTYFARRYGLEQSAVLVKSPGREPGAGEMADLVDLMREEGVKVIFAESQFDPRPARLLAEEAGGDVAVVTVDPLGSEGKVYVEMMRENLRAMEEAMK